MSATEIEEPISSDNIPIIEITENGIEGFEILCRLCANRSDHLIPIYSEEGISNDLSTKMNLYLPVKVSETDTLPLQCCFQCASTVLTWHELVIASVEADRRLRELQAEAEKHLQDQNLSIAQESLEEKLEIKTDSDDDREKSISNINRKPEDRLSTAQINKSILITNEVQDNKNIKKLQTNNFQCKTCKKFFAQKRYLDNHLKIHNTNREFTCEKCAKSFVGHGGLIRHIKDVHLGIKNYSCSVCSESFASSATRDDHMRRRHTSEKPFSCSFCNKKFSSKANLFQHKKIHENIFPFVCVICDKKFKRKHELLYHSTIHSGEKSHFCKICGRGFKISAALNRHLTVHSNIKPFKCLKCGQIYKQARSLSHHMKLKHKICVEEENSVVGLNDTK